MTPSVLPVGRSRALGIEAGHCNERLFDDEVDELLATMVGEVRDVRPLVVGGDPARFLDETFRRPSLATERRLSGPGGPFGCRGDGQTSSPASTASTLSVQE